jgi:hypothetical protein
MPLFMEQAPFWAATAGASEPAHMQVLLQPESTNAVIQEFANLEFERKHPGDKGGPVHSSE